jgi:2-keto-4-pentenoate hydratase/2-oxohepta-3-ene-1,7-dioic acid hydratase in catechol pathway
VRIGTLRLGSHTEPAIVLGDQAYVLDDVATRLGLSPETLRAVATIGDSPVLRDLASATARVIRSGGVAGFDLESLGPPIARPGKIICVGRNYAEHARETGSDIPTRPILFAKFATAIVGPHDDVVRPREVEDLDYEAELCVVIGRGGRHIRRDDALRHVTGYMCANDVSARTAQLKSGDQWLRGKSFDTFCPTGPAIVTRDEIPDPQSLRITCRVDGRTMQDASTADMIFDVATLVSYCSDVFTLEPGDLILTGTPSGVALGRDPAPWLQPGQVVEVEIEGVGRIANRIVDETGPAG